MKILSAFFSGLLFGLGLIVAGMANPAKVLAFLDVLGHWDPSLMFVMLGGISIGLLGFLMIKNKTHSLLGDEFALPSKRTIDKPLILGSLLFGVGWGMAGICPGPSLVLLGMGETSGVVFVASMLLGMVVFEGLQRFRKG